MVKLWLITGVLLTFVCIKFTEGTVNFTKIITTSSGPIRGKFESLPTGKTARKYLGIRYGKAKRFENPSDPEPWTNTVDAISFGKHCPQPTRDPQDPLSNINDTNEDCLFLNVYVPEAEPSPVGGYAVLLWIHGGAYVFGTAGNSQFDGGVLASEENVIVVACNYRIGALGLLSTGTADLKGNYGMLDQVHAVKWVHDNIARFGGDPRNVTLFGESAGAMSLSLLMLSPLTKGLFRRVILQSGAAPALYTALLDKEAVERAKLFADALGCNDLASLKICALKKTIKEIIQAQLKVKSIMMLSPFAPVVDGYFLTDAPMKLLNSGNFHKDIDVMIGVTRDEGSRFTVYLPGVIDALDVSKGLNQSAFNSILRQTTWVRGQNEQIVKAITYEYTNWQSIDNVDDTRQSFLDVHADCAYKAPAILSAQIFVKHKIRTFFYQMDYSSSVDNNDQPIPEWKRVFHGADLQYTFGVPIVRYNNNDSNIDVKFAKMFIKYWATFAKTGNPNPANWSPVWPAYALKDQKYISLKPTVAIKDRLLAKRMFFWNDRLSNFASLSAGKIDAGDKEKQLEEKDKIILGLAISVGLLGLLVIVLIIAAWCMRSTRS